MAKKPTYEELEERVKALEKRAADYMRTQEALRESEEKYRRLVEHAPTGIYNIDFLQDKFTSINDAMIVFSGYSREELLSMKVSSILTDPSKQLFFDRIKKASEGKEVPETVEMEFVIKDGTTRWASLSTSYIYENNKLIGASVIAQDITERKKAEKAVLESEKRFRELAESLPETIYEIDVEGRLTFVNRSAFRHFGYTRKEFDKGLNALDMLAPKDRDRAFNNIQKIISGEDIGLQEYTLLRKDGSTFPGIFHSSLILGDDKPIGLRGFIIDVTEKKRLEEQLQQSHKMEAIGTLAGGIAHEFNNILGIIIGNTELALDDVPGWNPAKDCLEEIRSASLRAKDVVRQILSFARKAPSERKPIQISTIIKESLKLLRATIPTTISIQEEMLCQSEMILASPTEINQVLINLCINSIHAMEDDTGVMSVRLQTVHLDDDSIPSYEGLKPGNHVRLTVKDSGQGIAPEIMDRIFDPYFTTKDVDKGLGMGLAVVYGIVKKHDGAITIESKVGTGTTVEVLFPIIEAAAETEMAASERLPTGTERILFVDDETSLVITAVRMLERLGYQVLGKTDSVEALDLFRSKPDRIDLVITDMAMPQMAGDRLVKKLRKIRPDVPIILCTGHSDRIDEVSAKSLGISAYCMKPLDNKTLAVIVRKVLDENHR